MTTLFLSHYLDAMNPLSRFALLLAPLMLVACHKKAPDPAPAPVVVVPVIAPAPVSAPATPAADPAKLTDEQKDTARRQEKLDFATMEDKFMTDPLAQWASDASASGSYGSPEPSKYHLPAKLIGATDGEYWQNKTNNIGFEWVQADYARPVFATEVRLVVTGGDGVGAINKVELQDTDGKWHDAWTGLSEVKRDNRGPRTWFVRTFPKTAYKVKSVKYTIANNVQEGSKEFDAAQLVGE
jgi:hypothetical protein